MEFLVGRTFLDLLGSSLQFTVPLLKQHNSLEFQRFTANKLDSQKHK